MLSGHPVHPESVGCHEPQLMHDLPLPASDGAEFKVVHLSLGSEIVHLDTGEEQEPAADTDLKFLAETPTGTAGNEACQIPLLGTRLLLARRVGVLAHPYGI